MDFVEIECLPANLHNQPHKFVPQIKKRSLKLASEEKSIKYLLLTATVALEAN